MCSQLSSYSIICIANHSDIINGIELHTIQENELWWENIMSKYFKLSYKEIKYNGRLYEYFCEPL